MEIFDNLKRTVLGEKQELDETSKVILDIENKKKAFIQASNNEQNSIMAKITDEFRNIGEKAYALYIEGVFDTDKFKDMFETIKTMYQTLDEKKVKISEILARYDEEINILRPAASGNQAVCPNCSASYIQGEVAFCVKCGNKIPDTAMPQSVCANCKTANNSDAAFCTGCGQKL